MKGTKLPDDFQPHGLSDEQRFQIQQATGRQDWSEVRRLKGER